MQSGAVDREEEARRRIAGLIARISEGEQIAFSQLHELTCSKMRRLALSIVRSAADVDDVLQDAYLKVWRHAGAFDPQKSSPISWMCIIVRNTAFDLLRRKKLQTDDLELALAVPDVCEHDDDFDYVFAQRIADNVLAKLPEDRRRLLALAYVDGLSREVLSQIFDAPKSTIKTWLRRTLEGVRIDCAALARRAELNLAVTARDCR